MITLTFRVNREIFRIVIENREIFYADRIWKRQIRFIPKDDDFIMKIIKSRNKIPKSMIQMFELTPKEKEQYEGAKTDEELAQICIKDVRMRGGSLIKKEDK